MVNGLYSNNTFQVTFVHSNNFTFKQMYSHPFTLVSDTRGKIIYFEIRNNIEVTTSGIWARSRPSTTSVSRCCTANWAEVKSTVELQRLLDSVFLNAHCWLSVQPQVTWRYNRNVHLGRSLHELYDCLFPRCRLLEWMSSSVLIHNYRWLAVAEHIPLWHMTLQWRDLQFNFT